MSNHPANSPPTEPVALTVSQLNRQIKRLLEGQFDFVWIVGELSNLAQPDSGHWYFTLKDDAAQVRCAMFRNRNQRLRLTPRNGQQLLMRARVSLYEGRGDYQLIVEHMQDAGAGALQQAFTQLKQQLQQEGLFAAELKQPLPDLPKRVAVVTSPNAAALRDILSVFRRRASSIDIDVLPVPVQGADAAAAIAGAIALAARSGLFDALIVARGGGSVEDLWAFNEESVARAIAACSIPVVSAIGHETDFTIADFVADLRAPTPSAAAELLSPNAAELGRALQQLQSQLARALQQQLTAARQQLTALRQQLRQPGERLREQAQRLDELDGRLRRAGLVGQQQQHRLALARLRLWRQSPALQLSALGLTWQHLARHMGLLGQRNVQTQRHRLTLLSGRLDALSPLATLERGYALVSDSAGRLVTDAAKVETGQVLRTQLAAGRLRSRVIAE